MNKNLARILPVIATPSRTEVAQRCYRRHALGDALRKATYYSPSLEFGSVIHAGAAPWWMAAKLGKPYDEGVKDMHKAIVHEWTTRFDMNPRVNKGDLSLDMAAAMMVHTYAPKARAAGPFELETNEWQIVTVEERLELPLDQSGLVLSFQTDRIVYNRENDHLVVVDTKTAGRLDQRWARQWETSLQMKLYKVGTAIAYDMDPNRVDVVIEGVLKDVPSNIRYEVCPNWGSGLLDEALEQAKFVAGRDKLMLQHEGLPRDVGLIEELAVNHTPFNYQDCFSYGVECPFRRLCLADPDQRVSMLHGEYFTLPQEY